MRPRAPAAASRVLAARGTSSAVGTPVRWIALTVEAIARPLDDAGLGEVVDDFAAHPEPRGPGDTGDDLRRLVYLRNVA
jgi:hypothetical protein